MAFEELALLSRRSRIGLVLLLCALVAAVIWATLQFLQPGPPRRVVLASGSEFGLYHRYAQQYKQRLEVEGVKVDERMTSGASENLRLLLDPKSGVDVAFMQGGLAPPQAANDLVMIASLYYEPLWLFYHGNIEINKLAQLAGKRIAAGIPGSGTRALVDQLDKVTGMSAELVGLGGDDALRAVKNGEVVAAFFVGGAQTPLIQEAMRDPTLTLISAARADGFARQFPFLKKLILPTGAIDLKLNVPDHDIKLIGTKAMLVARSNLHPALVNLLLDTAREIHGQQGYFEEAGEFPEISPVDLPVSDFAEQHKRFGPSLLYRYLPFWLAAAVERTIIILLPLLVIVVPTLNYLPQILRWRVRSRIIRWYGELAVFERDVLRRKGPPPTEQWLKDLARIETSVAAIRVPAKYANEVYTLREHIDIVRRDLTAKTGALGMPVDEGYKLPSG